MKTVLAIDQSTSGTKALLFDLQGQLLGSTSRDHTQHYPRPGWVEHDAEEIYQNTLGVVCELLKNAPEAGRDLLCLSLTNQRETVVVFERGSGRPLYPALVWQCRRGTPICEQLRQEGWNDRVRQRTGLTLDTYFSASKLRWLVENELEIAAKLQRGEALIGTIDAYLIYRLTGGKTFATDSTNASRTLLYDIQRLIWDPELCGLFKVPCSALPEVRESSAGFGETPLEGILDRPIPIRGVMGDSQASQFAQRCFTPGMAKVTFGTGSSLLLNMGDTCRLAEQGVMTTLAWQLHGKPIYALEGIINFSAATVSWLKNQLQLIESAAETESLALAVPDNGGVYLVPAFVGLSAPYWQPNARAAILGLTAHSSKSHVVRAALESIAYQVKDALDLMVAEAGVPLRGIWGDGGASRNRFLMQFTADMIRYPLRVSRLAELSALGAVFMGLLGLGEIDSFEQIERMPLPVEEYTPQMAEAEMQHLYDGWKAAVRQVL